MDLKQVKGIKIDPKIFSFKFNCECRGECCHYGVYTDFNEYKKILSIKDELIQLMDSSQTKDFDKWFEEPEKDDDFESGIAVGTQIINGKCVFLDKDGLCVLQKYANEININKWEFKPKYCILFPLTIYENTLTIDDEHIERLKTCNKHFSNISIFEYCKEELKYFFGVDGFNELLKIQKKIIEIGETIDGNKK